MAIKNKKIGVRVKFPLVTLLFLSIFCISVVSAVHNITTSTGTTSYSILEDVSATINITVNNTDSGQNANLTQVNITMSSANLTFSDNSTNGTSLISFWNISAVNYTFVISGRTLSWTNSTTYLMNGSESKFFWINITAVDPGNFNITVTTVNITSSYSSNISVTVNDTTAPVIVLLAPANETSSTTSAYSFAFNLSSDASAIANCSLVFNGSIINSSSSLNTSEVNSNSFYNASLDVGTHNWSINCTDSAGNVGASETRVLTVTAGAVEEESSSSSSSSSGGSSVQSLWKNTFVADDKELKEKGIITRDFADDNRVKLKINSKTHYIGVTHLTSSTVTIEVSSTPQQATLSIGSNKKFDVDDDGYYDIIVKLNSISGNKAGISVESINEKIAEIPLLEGNTEETAEETQPDISPEKIANDSSLNQSKNIWIIGIIIIVALIASILYYILSKKRR